MSKIIEVSMDVNTREAEEVNDFTTEERNFKIPTVINPINTVLCIRRAPHPSNYFNTVSSA